MAGLSEFRLRALLLGSLPGARVAHDFGHTKPIILDVPDVGLIRIYLWTTTPDASVQGRPLGEHKAQIILPGTPRGSRQVLDLKDMPTALLGYSPLFGVFSTWQAELHADSGYSKNLQFREEVLELGSLFGWSVGETRATQLGPEVRMAVHPLHLVRYLSAMREADAQRISGEARRAFMIRRAPRSQILPATESVTATTERERVRITTTRLSRSSPFGQMIREAYGKSCAVCSLQLSIVEGAHIIPVHDPRSRDECWNGVSLCPNHHTLYDSRIMRIDGSGVVQVAEEEVSILRKLNLLQGYDQALKPHIGHPIQFPLFAQTDPHLRSRLLQAFETVCFA